MKLIIKHLVVSEKVYNFEPENEKRHNGVTKDKIEILKIVSKSLLLEILTVFFCMKVTDLELI